MTPVEARICMASIGYKEISIPNKDEFPLVVIKKVSAGIAGSMDQIVEYNPETDMNQLIDLVVRHRLIVQPYGDRGWVSTSSLNRNAAFQNGDFAKSVIGCVLRIEQILGAQNTVPRAAAQRVVV